MSDCVADRREAPIDRSIRKAGGVLVTKLRIPSRKVGSRRR
jgi:hypothetical protein